MIFITSNLSRRSFKHILPSLSSITITFATDSLQGNKLEWCSWIETKTIGLTFFSFQYSTSNNFNVTANLKIAEEEPLPVKIVAYSASEAFNDFLTMFLIQLIQLDEF